MYTVTGAKSGYKSDPQALASDSPTLYAMPKGALYWYGNECSWITGGYVINDVMSTSRTVNGTVTRETNSVYLGTTDYSDASFRVKNKINLTNYSKIKGIVTDVVIEAYVRIHETISTTSIPPTLGGFYFAQSSPNVIQGDIDFNLVGNYYIAAVLGGERCGRYHAFWLE